MLQGKKIVLGVSGGIAAYKAAALCSRLTQAQAEVHVIMTASACKFVAPLTFQTLTRQPVAVDTFDEKEPSVVSHIDLADKADLFVVAPATANIIAKMAHGLADDMLSTTLLATTAPIMVAPAMNVHMYTHPAVQANLELLHSRGVRFVEPGEGPLACGYVGKGRLAEPEQIFAAIERQFHGNRRLAGKKVLITAGGTIERIDPVRYITNDSSGKMGFALAEAAREMGAQVTLVAGKTNQPAPPGIDVIPVVSAEDMFRAVLDKFPQTDIVVKAAAVADYRPAQASTRKIKKKDEALTLQLVRNEDILLEIGRRKSSQYIVGFAAETDDLERYAMDKLQRKNCDLIVANDVTQEGAGFGTETNIVQVFDKNGLVSALPILSKQETAERIMELVADRLPASRGDA